MRQRGSRHIRSENPPNMRLTERDKQVVKAVNDYHAMSQSQIANLLFPSENTTQRRLRLLWEHGYLKRQFPKVIGGVQNSTIYYLVDKKGVELLQREFDYTDEIRWSRRGLSDRFIDHTLGLGDIRLSVELSCRRHGLALHSWEDEHAVKSSFHKHQSAGRLAITPDAYFLVQLSEHTGLRFFLEFDRGAEALKYIGKKIRAFWTFYHSPSYQRRYGDKMIRILFVTEAGIAKRGTSRLENLHRITERLGAHTWFWFASLEDINNADFLTAPIWWQTHKKTPVPLHTFSN